MSKKKSDGKQSKERMFKTMAARKKQSDAKKAVDLGKLPVSRAELFAIQQTINTRTDSALMGVAAIVEILVKNKLCTYEDFKNGERGMLDILKFIRKSMGEAYKELGQEARSEDVGAFIYEKAITFGVDKDILTNIFGVKSSESRIIKPNQANSIIIPK